MDGCRMPGTARPILRRLGAQIASGAGLWAVHVYLLPEAGAGVPGAVICTAGGLPFGALATSPFAMGLAMNIGMAAAMLITTAGIAANERRPLRPCLSALTILVLQWAAWAVACTALALWPAGPEPGSIRAVAIGILLVASVVGAVRSTGEPARVQDAGRQPSWTDAAGLRQNGPCMTVMALAGMSLPLMVGASLAMAMHAALPHSPASRVSETLVLTAGLSLALL